MKYFKKNGNVSAFPIDDDMIPMTEEEVDRHINPMKYWPDEKKEEYRLEMFPYLSRRQFKIALLNHGLSHAVERAIEAIDNEYERDVMRIEYNESTEFYITSSAVLTIFEALEIEREEFEEMWMEASGL